MHLGILSALLQGDILLPPVTCHQTVNAIFQMFAPTPSWERQQEVESPLRYSIGFMKSSLASYIVRLRPLNSQCVPFSCASLSASGRMTGSGDNVSRTVDDGYTLPHSILRLDRVKFIRPSLF